MLHRSDSSSTWIHREAVGHDDTELHASLALYRALASGALMCCAGIYALGWVLCLGVIKESACEELGGFGTCKQQWNSVLGRTLMARSESDMLVSTNLGHLTHGPPPLLNRPVRLRRSHDREKARQEYLSLDKRRAELEKLLGNEPAI